MSVEAVLGNEKVATTMREFRRGTLRSGSKKGPKVKGRKQAIALALSQGRRSKRGTNEAGNIAAGNAA